MDYELWKKFFNVYIRVRIFREKEYDNKITFKKKHELTIKVEAFNQIYRFLFNEVIVGIVIGTIVLFRLSFPSLWFVLVSIEGSRTQRLKIGNKNTSCFQETFAGLKATCIFQLDVSLVFYSFTRDIHARVERPTKFRLTKFDEGGELAR